MCHKSVKVTLKIEGMKCEGCAMRIENILAAQKQVNSYHVSLETKTATLLLKKTAKIDDIIQKIENLDFKVDIVK